MGEHLNLLDQQMQRYKKEKKEILLGSAKVGRENWAQDISGELGKVTGAKEIEERLEVLGAAGDRFDLANLFLQLGLVLGAIGILMRGEQAKKAFYMLLLASGTTGLVFSLLAFSQAMQ